MNQATHLEQQIIALLERRDKIAISLIWDHYADALYSVIFKVVPFEEIAKDLLQDVFVKIWNNSDKYNVKKGRLYTWLLNIARNTAIDHLRSSGYRMQSVVQAIDSQVNNDSQHSSNMGIDHIGMEKEIRKLNPKHRQIIDLIYFQGYTHKEIEEELGIPLGTVKSRLRLAIKALRRAMKVIKS